MPIITTEELLGQDTPQNIITTEELFKDEQPKKSLTPHIPESRKMAVRAGELMAKNHPVAGNLLATLAGIEGTAEDIFKTPAANFLNQFLLNLPRAISVKAGREYPSEANTLLGQLLAKGAGVTGALVNPLTRIAGGMGNAPLRAKILTGLISGAAYTPTEDIVGLKQRATAGAISGAIPAVGAGIQKILSAIPNRNDIAGRIINSLIKPSKGQFGYGKNPGLAVAQEKLVGNNLDELAENIAQRRGEIGKQIGVMVDKAEDLVNMKGVLNPLDEALTIARKAPATNQALITRLEGIRSDLRGIIGGKDLELATPILANEMKQQIGTLTKFTGNPSDDKLANMALKQVYGRLKGRIEQVVPGVKSLNERWGNLMTAEIATNNRNQILQRQNMVSFRNAIGGGVAGFILSGGKALPAVLTGVSAELLGDALKSPVFKTRIAAALAKTTSEQRRTIFAKMPQLKELIIKGGITLPSRLVDKIKSENAELQ